MKILTTSDLPENFFDPIDLSEQPNVKEILLKINEDGDDSVRYYADLYDGLGDASFEINKDDIDKAYKIVDKSYITAVREAVANIKDFAEHQLASFHNMEFQNDYGRFGHRIIPIERVGCYVPGGHYPLPSSALMTIIPAKVAGVELVVVCSPKITSETIVAAVEAGADRIFRLGGVQAIGAMAYGTESVPAVDKIVGPGNIYVTAAKREVFGQVGIDFIAGPSEVMVIADTQSNISIVASDLLAQAEHDTEATAYAIVPTRDLATKIQGEVLKQLESLETYDIAQKAVDNSYIIVEPNIENIAKIINKLAPEHLELQTSYNEKLIPLLRNYGSLFIGIFSAEVFGDYCSGPNHTLPTNRTARYTGGLSVKDFIKFHTYQELNQSHLITLIDTAAKIARAEGLHAHRLAAEKRNDIST